VPQLTFWLLALLKIFIEKNIGQKENVSAEYRFLPHNFLCFILLAGKGVLMQWFAFKILVNFKRSIEL
jgi:hypothetical protein